MKLNCMKNILLIFLFLLSVPAFSQQSNAFFGQCLIEVQNREDMMALEASMRENPYARVVRLDYETQRAFVLTKDIQEFTEDNFVSWFGEYGDHVRCIQIGVHGVDAVKPYPFTDCENDK